MTEKNTGSMKLSDREKRIARRHELQAAAAAVNPDGEQGIHTTERTRPDGKNEIVVALNGVPQGEVLTRIGRIVINGIGDQKIPGLSLTRPVIELNTTGIDDDSKGRVDVQGGLRTVGINDMGVGAEQVNPDTIVAFVISPTNLMGGDITPKLT